MKTTSSTKAPAKAKGKTITVSVGPQTLAYLERRRARVSATVGTEIDLTTIVRAIILMEIRQTPTALAYGEAPESLFD